VAGSILILRIVIVVSVRFRCRSPPRLRRCPAVLPDDAGDGTGPGESGHRGLGAEPAGVRPGDENAGGHHRCDTAQLEQLRGVLNDQLGDVGSVAGQVGGTRADASREADSFAAAGRGRGVVVAVALRGDRGDLATRQRRTGPSRSTPSSPMKPRPRCCVWTRPT
jgi:hypothetical protein